MENLIRVSESKLMSSKRIAEKTGKRHDHVLRDVRNMITELEKEGSPNLGGHYQVVSYTGIDNNVYTEEILLNERLSLCLGAGYSIPLRMMIIDDWAEMKAQSMSGSLSTMDILQIAMRSEQERLRLDAENKVLAPKAEYTDKVLQAEGTMTTTNVAEDLGMTAQALNKFLVNHGVIRFHDGRYILTARYLGKGYADTRTHVDTKNRVHHYLVWTEYGRAFINGLINPDLSFSKAS